MPEFHDLCRRDNSREMRELAEELGWTTLQTETAFLEADSWGELKRKIGDARADSDVLVFLGGDEELNLKAASDTRVDVLLHPERERKDSGVNHVIAKEAADNHVAIGFDLQQLMVDGKERTHVLRHWRRNLMLCEKYDAPYVITTGARTTHQLRAPRDLASIIDSLGYHGRKAVSDHPSEIIERAERARGEGFIRPGQEVEKD